MEAKNTELRTQMSRVFGVSNDFFDTPKAQATEKNKMGYIKNEKLVLQETLLK